MVLLCKTSWFNILFIYMSWDWIWISFTHVFDKKQVKNILLNVKNLCLYSILSCKQEHLQTSSHNIYKKIIYLIYDRAAERNVSLYFLHEHAANI